MAQLYYPLSSSLVSEWPGDRGGYWHYGTDFAVPVNTSLRASFDGVVVFAGGDGASGQYAPGIWANGEGLTVDIQHADGLIARYGHMNRIDVEVGQVVKARQQIGLSGNTGYTTGPHCHWELRWDRLWSGGAWADPRDLGAVNFATASVAVKAWEDTMKYFVRVAARSKPQVVKADRITRAIFNDKGDVTFAYGTGDIVGASASVRLKGKPGGRVEVTMVRETVKSGKNTKTVRVAQERAIFDDLGLATVNVAGSTPIKDQRMRILIHGSKTAGDITVDRYEVGGYVRPA